MKLWSRVSDWMFLYVAAWVLILSFPLWLPVYLARKLAKWSDEPYSNKKEEVKER